MSLMRFTEEGPEPPLRNHEYAECQGCRERFTPEDIEDAYDDPYAEGIWDPNYERAVCPSCGTFEAFVRRRRARGDYAWARRWGREVSAHGVTPMPQILCDFLAELRLDATDLALLVLYEGYRRCDEAVYPSQVTIARKAGLAERTVRSRVGDWTSRGLCERQRSHRRDGSRGTDRITRHGLTSALRLIAENAAANREPTYGLAELLARLEAQASARRGRTGRPGAQEAALAA